jgi:hypothetical protein
MDVAECSLADLMDDPLVGLVMKSDGVNRAELKPFFERVARAIASDLAANPRRPPCVRRTRSTALD